MLNDMMLFEVTKESVSYGYTLKREDYKRKLVSGQEIDVIKAVLTFAINRELHGFISYY